MAVLTATAATVIGEDFYSHWGDGRAEISSYRIEQSRYGESREAYGVLVFVTEDLSAKTKIKAESSTPAAGRIYVLKLNNLLKFTTGIYDYSVMTSVFSAVEPRNARQPFELQKLSLSSQDWCGHVFEEVYAKPDVIVGDLNSYFEREGRQQWQLERPQNFESEDHLLIRIRELKGNWLQNGESIAVTMLPSLWTFRVRHGTRKLVHTIVTKGKVEEIEVGGKTHKAVRWSWGNDHSQKVVWVEQAASKRILAWTDANSSAELMRTIRVPYWHLKANSDAIYREQLGIP